MKAVVLREIGKPLVFQEIKTPSIKTHEVLVKIEAAEVSRSVVERVKGTTNVPMKTPIILGTGGAGTVVETGSQYIKVKKGDRVAINPLVSCGSCYNCIISREDLCEILQIRGFQVNGTFAEYMALPETSVFKIPHSLTFKEAAIMPSTIGTPYSALVKAGLASETVICVFGLGALGLSAIQIGKVKGAKVLGVDISADKLEQAKKLGIDEAINAKANVEQKIKELSSFKSGIDIALVTIGDVEAIELSIKCVRKGGIVIILADPREKMSFAPRIFMSGVTILGSTLFRKVDIPEMVRLAEEKRILIEPLIDRVYPMDRINEAIEELDRNSSKMNRMVVVP